VRSDHCSNLAGCAAPANSLTATNVHTMGTGFGITPAVAGCGSALGRGNPAAAWGSWSPQITHQQGERGRGEESGGGRWQGPADTNSSSSHIGIRVQLLGDRLTER